jgi:hypothetical protein
MSVTFKNIGIRNLSNLSVLLQYKMRLELCTTCLNVLKKKRDLDKKNYVRKCLSQIGYFKGTKTDKLDKFRNLMSVSVSVKLIFMVARQITALKSSFLVQ